jgi:hypothetical protein
VGYEHADHGVYVEIAHMCLTYRPSPRENSGSETLREVGWACSTHAEDEKCVEFRSKTLKLRKILLGRSKRSWSVCWINLV